ncbi:LysR family transcriptional regulator [Enterovibrio baiacu]|uniref:LysR family transcriptional regulator n=1 Tax=Enterovibrio baiacu TaxID=2491023 RepID=UPI001F0BB591|nr:LysR family transcriptional regulator [Enterovibrio baiacu]
MMKALQDFRIFIETAEQGSLSAVARNMDLTPAATSAAVKRLEKELGTPLFIRSTRSLRLTPDGEAFLQQCQQAIQLLDDSAATLKSGQTVVSGVIQLSLPSDLGRNQVLEWLDAFLDTYPLIELRLHLSDRIADVYSQPVDLALRYGEPPASNLIALPIEPNNYRVLCASPEYIAAYGNPKTPDELTQHNCLCFAVGDTTHTQWAFWKKDEEKATQHNPRHLGINLPPDVSVNVKGNRMADDGEAVRRWALSGRGIAYKSYLDIREDIRAGKLVIVCEDWLGQYAPLNLICADRRQLNPAVQALRQFLIERCRE